MCAFFIIIGGTQEAYKAGDRELGEDHRPEGPAHRSDGADSRATTRPIVIKARDAGCDAVHQQPIEPRRGALGEDRDAQKITGINWLFLAPGYTVQVAKALADTKQPIYVGTEWEPYTEQNSPANKDWIAAMNAAKRPLTAFSQGGYLCRAGDRSTSSRVIDGAVTRESVNKALRDDEADHLSAGRLALRVRRRPRPMRRCRPPR